MNWKIIVGGILIFLGIAQGLRLLTEYQYQNSSFVTLVHALLIAFVLFLGFRLLKAGRREEKNKIL